MLAQVVEWCRMFLEVASSNGLEILGLLSYLGLNQGPSLESNSFEVVSSCRRRQRQFL